MTTGKFRELPSPADRAASAPFMIISVVARRGMGPVLKVWPIEVLNEGSLRPQAVVIADVPWHADDISPSFFYPFLVYPFSSLGCLVIRTGITELGPCLPSGWPPCSFLHL